MVTSGRIREAYETHIATDLRHHNAYFPGDAASLMHGMEENDAAFPDKIFEVKHVLEDGDFVAVHSHIHLTPGDLGIAVVHLFRISDDRIVEMWDVGQPVPPDCPNENGVF